MNRFIIKYSILFISIFILLTIIFFDGSIVYNGISTISYKFLTHSMFNVDESTSNGGIYHAIIGTLEQGITATLLASIISFLIAFLYIDIIKSNAVRHIINIVLNLYISIPSIVFGLLVMEIMIYKFGFKSSGFLGVIALTLIVIPYLIVAFKEIFILYNLDMKLYTFGLGVTYREYLFKFVIPIFIKDYIDILFNGFIRVASETAPIVILIFGTTMINYDLFHNPQESLTVYINYEARQPYITALNRAWGASLTMILLLVCVYIISMIISFICRHKR